LEELPAPLQVLIRGVWYFFTSPNIIRVVKSSRILGAKCVAFIGAKRIARRSLVGKLQGKKPFGRPRNRWKYVVKIRLLRQI
jgi:hypothetical protein